MGQNNSPVNVKFKPPVVIKPSETAGFPFGYTPRQVRTAYGINKLIGQGINGKNQKIAIVTAFGSPTIQNDLDVFNNMFGLPLIRLNIHYPQGQPTKLDVDWAVETALDVEWAHALAPRATIELVVALDNTFANLLSAVDYASNLGVQVVSMSWGSPEFPDQTNYDFHFQHPGIVYVASSGDGGNPGSWPSSSPNVVSVGGTNLVLGSGGGRLCPETAWGGSGGGISPFEPEPSYQVDYGIDTGNLRAYPDVSLVADPYTGVPLYTSTGYNGWLTVGGTSLSAPCWAAIFALADQIRNTPLTDGHSALYNLAKANYSLYFREISAGGNGTTGVDCATRRGYDYVTGLGSPKADQLVLGLGNV